MVSILLATAISFSRGVTLNTAAMRDFVVSWRSFDRLGPPKAGKVTVRFGCNLQNNTSYAVGSFKFRLIAYGARTWQADREVTSFKDPATGKKGNLPFGKLYKFHYDVEIPEDVSRTTRAYWIEPLAATGTPIAGVSSWRTLTALPIKGKSTTISFGTAADMAGSGFRTFRNQTQDDKGNISWFDGSGAGRIDANTKGPVFDDRRFMAEKTGHEENERRLIARPGDDLRPIDIRFTAPRNGLYMVSMYAYLHDGVMANALINLDGKKLYTSTLQNNGAGLQTEFPLPLNKGQHLDLVWARDTNLDLLQIGFDLRVIGGPKS
jgi:hypothetical protein